MKDYTFVDYATQVYVLVVAALILCFHNDTVPHWAWLVGAHSAILALVHLLILLNVRRRTPGLLDFFRHFYPVFLYIFFYWETGEVNRIFIRDYMDPLAIRWDQALFGCQPSIKFMEKLPFPAVSELFYAAYFSYYVMIGGVGLALFLRSRQQFFHYVSLVSFVFYVCYVIYIGLPIIGPRIFLHEIAGYSLPPDLQKLAPDEPYPAGVPAGPFFRLMGFIYRVFESPGAAMPSSHVAVALCTVFFSFRYLRPIRFVHLGVAVLLCLSTVYCRYHYVVDVLAGFLTAAVLVPLGDWMYVRFTKPTLEIPSPKSDPQASGSKLPM